MMPQLLRNAENAMIYLRALYRKYGYLLYKMSKFEEYDLYQRNKDFLISDRIITFTDTNGKLMALKPDVTLSILKNGEDIPGCKQKVCYHENVYRVSGQTHQYKEILQTGLECIGDIDLYDIFEVVSLAAESLAAISTEYVLDVSHLGVLSALLTDAGVEESLGRELVHCIAEKNAHDLKRLCAEAGLSPEIAERFCIFTDLSGTRAEVLDRLKPICTTNASQKALAELAALSALLAPIDPTGRIRFDFSVVNDMSYYSGIVFRGFVDGICEGVLSGGQYGKLMRKMGRKADAIGFALYLDLLEDTAGEAYDVDLLVLYDDKTDRQALAQLVRAQVAAGKRVSAQRAIPPKLRYAEAADWRKGAEKC